MAIGDKAAAKGWPTYASTQDAEKGYENDNQRGDDLADHVDGATGYRHAANSVDISAVSGLTAALAAKGDATAVATAQATADAAEGLAFQARDGDLDIAVWNREITWTRRAGWIGNSGQVLLGYAPSTRASKTDIVPVPWSIEQLRAIPVIHYRYLAELAKAQADPNYHVATEIGTIADDLHELGLWELVIYDGHGDDAVPIGVHPELLGFAALRLAQIAFDRLDALQTQIDDLRALVEGESS